MPGFLVLAGPAGLDGPLLEVLLPERPLAPGAPDRLDAVAGMAASLAGPPEPALA